MRFAVPQFIDVEDKIFGPLTLKQAIYIAGAIGLIMTIFSRLGLMWTIVIGAPVGLLAFALAFLKINNRPFYLVVYAAVFFSMRNKLYLWKRVPKKQRQQELADAATATEELLAPKLSQSRLKELAWSLDTRESMYENKDQWK